MWNAASISTPESIDIGSPLDQCCDVVPASIQRFESHVVLQWLTDDWCRPPPGGGHVGGGGAVAYPGARLTPWLMTDPGGHDVCVSGADDRLVTVVIAVITASSRLVTDAKVCSSPTHTLSALQAR